MVQSYFTPGGRITRLQFWRGIAFVLLAAELALIATSLAVFLVIDKVVDRFQTTFVPPDALLFAILGSGLILTGWACLALTARRLHDQDLSGWWALALFVPVLGFLWTLAWNGTRPGTAGANRFGPDPRGGAISDVFGDDTPPLPRPRVRLASTIIAWSALSILTVGLVLLFQNPNR